MSATSVWVRDVRETDFEREVLERSKEQPVVVDFWAPWCSPCRLLAPLLERLVGERNGEVLLAKVNVDEAQGLAAEFGISSIPAVKAFRDGRVVREFEGLLPEAYLRAFFDEIVPGEADRLMNQARAQEGTKPAEAERLYRQALDRDRNNEAVRLGLARVLLAQDKTDEIADLLEPVSSEGELGAEAERLKAQVYFRRLARDFGDEEAARRRLEASPDNAPAQYELGCLLARKGDYAGALPLLLSAGERDPKFAATKVREAMVNIFYALGSDHPLANEYRMKLTRLLY
jgi:putative thioredoxin